jgi:outer membrane protein, heavy metal efflux system
MRQRPITRAAILLASLALAGCAGLPSAGGRDAVQGELASRFERELQLAAPGPGELDDAIRARIAEPLDPEAAVEIALRLSPRVKGSLAGLGIAAADLYESRRPRNPKLSASRVGDETAFGLHLMIGDLLTLPARRGIGAARWQAAVAEVAAAVLDEATAVRQAYFRHQAAEQVAAMRAAVAEATELSAEMARRFHAAGNISALQLAHEEANATSAATDAARARAERLATRMELAERLGLAGRSNRWHLPEQLPLPPAGQPDVNELLALAAERRLDLAAAHAALDADDRSAALARRLRWLGTVELGIEHEREHGRRRTGPELAFELPLFDQGRAGLARADARREQALQRLELISLGIERDVRSGAARLAILAEIVDAYREALIPQREAIVARELERYNFMFIGVFELLQAKRAEYDAYQGYLEAIRDYWLAHAELAGAVGGRLPGEAAGGWAPSIEQILSPPAGDDHDHHHHHHGHAAPAAAEHDDHGHHHDDNERAAPAETPHGDHHEH